MTDSVTGFNALLDHEADLAAYARNPQPGERTPRVIETTVAHHPQFLRAAIDHGFVPDFVAEPALNDTLLFIAVRSHSEKHAAIFLDAGGNPHHRNVAGVTAMMEAVLSNDYRMAWFLLTHGADPTICNRWNKSVVDYITEYGARGITPEQMPYFEKVVAELENRGLITRQDIVDADKPKNVAGITTIVHPPHSDIGRAIREMDKAEQEAFRRDRDNR